jgi:L-rhamnose-H+ transport protein
MDKLMTGLLIVVVASVLQGSFMVPMSYVRKWKWENSWAVFSILAMIVFNWALAWLSIPSLAQIYKSASVSTLGVPAVFGACWGIGAVCFGLGMAAVGFALGYAIIMGIVLSFGAFIPMVVLHPNDILSSKGILILVGLAVMVVGIAVFGLAGIRKEKEQGEKTGAITETSTLSIRVGLVICIAAGILSCLTNVGFSMSQPLIDLALRQNASEKWASNSVWAILFTFGGIANLSYCGYLFVKNKSFGAYRQAGSFRNLMLLAFMSLMWIGSFVLYGLGARMMGDWGTVIGWSAFIALSITIASIWGFAQGEWARTSPATRKLMAAGLAILVLVIFIFACGNVI